MTVARPIAPGKPLRKSLALALALGAVLPRAAPRSPISRAALRAS